MNYLAIFVIIGYRVQYERIKRRLQIMSLSHFEIYSVAKGLAQHKVFALNGAQGIHMDPDRSVVIEPLEQSLYGKQFDLERSGWTQFSANELLCRASELKAKRRYSLLSYNCEDFIEELLGNEPKSPQRNFWIAAIVCAGIIAVAARK